MNLPPDAELDRTELPALTEEEDRIRAILSAEENENATYEIFRKSLTGKYDYLDGLLPLSDLSNGDYRKRICESFGGGDYKIRIRKSDGRMAGTVPFSVDKSVRPLAERFPAGTAGGTDMVKLIETLRPDKKEQGGELFLAMMQMQSQQMAAQMAQFGQMMTAVLGRAAPPASPLPEKMLEIMLNRMGSGGMDLDKVFSFVEKLRTLNHEEEAPDETSFDRLIDTVRELAPLLLAKMPALGAAAPVPEIPVRPEPKPVAPESAELRARLAEYLILLCGQCDAGAAAPDLADWLKTHLKGQELQGVQSTLAGEHWLEDLTGLHAPVAARAGWFRELRAALL
ncbi:MAG: hypothetical protein ACRD2F_03585 [Terriglobales bacterium]